MRDFIKFGSLALAAAATLAAGLPMAAASAPPSRPSRGRWPELRSWPVRAGTTASGSATTAPGRRSTTTAARSWTNLRTNPTPSGARAERGRNNNGPHPNRGSTPTRRPRPVGWVKDSDIASETDPLPSC